jgi:hypothetical protein
MGLVSGPPGGGWGGRVDRDSALRISSSTATVLVWSIAADGCTPSVTSWCHIQKLSMKDISGLTHRYVAGTEEEGSGSPDCSRRRATCAAVATGRSASQPGVLVDV